VREQVQCVFRMAFGKAWFGHAGKTLVKPMHCPQKEPTSEGGRYKIPADLLGGKIVKLFLVGGGEFAELSDGGGNDFEGGGYFLSGGVAAEAEADAGASFFWA
jgi:hypothetical protein